MKSLDFLKEGFVEDASEAHQDHEVQMARQECFNTAENALALHKLLRNISEAQGLEGWVSSKITLANDYLKRVREYLEYEFLTKDINEITPQITIAENAESKKKLIEYKIVSGQEGKTQNYVITGLDTKTLDQLARAYYGAIKLEQDPKNPNVTTIIWNLPTAGPAPYGSYDSKLGTATFIKKMTDAGDQLAKSVKSVERSVEEGRAVSAGIDNISSAKKLWQYVRRNLTDLASNAEFYADLNKLYIEDKLSNLFKTADGQQVKIAFTTGGGIKFDQGILYIPIGVMWYYRGMYTSESFVNGVINALNGKQEMEEGLDLDQQAMSVADQLTSGKNLEKLQAMRHDSTVYRALDRYFAKNNIPENIYNRVANIVFKRINQQGVAEGAPELLKKEMPLHRHAEKLLAQNGISKDDPDYQHHLANTIKHLRKFGNIDQINKQKISEGKEFGEGDIQRWAQKSPKNKEIYDEYEKVNQLAKKAWADKDGAAYTGLQNKRYYLRKLIGQKMSGEQGVAEGSEYTPPKLGTVKASIMNTTTPTVQIQVFKHNTLRGDSYWVTKQVKKFKTMDQAKAYVDRINNQGVAEGKKDPDELSRYENDVKTLLANGDIKTAKKVAGLSPDAAHRNHLRNIIRHYDSKQGVAEGSDTNTFSDFHDWKEAVYAMNADITQMGRAGQYTAIGSNGVIGKFDSRTNQGYINGQQGVAEAQSMTTALGNALSKVEPGSKLDKKIRHHNDMVRRFGPEAGTMTSAPDGYHIDKKGFIRLGQGVAEGKKCNHTMEGTECPVHGLTECPMQENKKLKETSAGSVAGVNNPPGKNSGKKKSQIGSLFGGTYKQPVHETDFAGEKTTPPQKPGDQVRGTENPIKKGNQQPFYHRLVGNE